MPKLLIIDDDQDFLDMMSQFLSKEKHEISLLSNTDNVIEVIKVFCPDLIISDIMMPGVTGASIYEAIRKNCPKHVPVIICSGTSMKLKRVKDPLLDYCPKPVDFTKLKETITRLIDQSKEQKKTNP
jgi:DNA-binding NtrC family response regulator